jgi:hypothetical protein
MELTNVLDMSVLPARSPLSFYCHRRYSDSTHCNHNSELKGGIRACDEGTFSTNRDCPTYDLEEGTETIDG